MTESPWQLKLGLSVIVMLLLVLSISLWLKTPYLFEYFNQAFCAH